MKRKVDFFKKLKLSIPVFLFLQMFIFVLPGQAEVTYYDVSRSINDAFSGKQIFSSKNIIGTVMTILFFVLVVLIFRLSWLIKEKELSQKRQSRIKLRPLGQQRKRKWYRLRTNMEFKWMFAVEASKSKEKQYKNDCLVDISGGGLSFRTAEKLNPGDKIKLLLDLGGGKTLSTQGRVLRIEKEVEQNNAMYKISIQFEDLLNRERDRLVSFIMKRQRHSIQSKKWEDTSLSSQSRQQ